MKKGLLSYVKSNFNKWPNPLKIENSKGVTNMRTIKKDIKCDKKRLKTLITSNIKPLIMKLNNTFIKDETSHYELVPSPMNILYKIAYITNCGNNTVFSIDMDLNILLYDVNSQESEIISEWFYELQQEITFPRSIRMEIFDKHKESVKLNNFLADQGYTITNTKELLKWYLKTIDNTQRITKIDD